MAKNKKTETPKRTRKSSGPRKAGPKRVVLVAEKVLELVDKMIAAVTAWTSSDSQVLEHIDPALAAARAIETGTRDVLTHCEALTSLRFPSRSQKLTVGAEVVLTMADTAAEELKVVSGSLWTVKGISKGLVCIADADDRRTQVRPKCLTRV